jgi:hypothetical protein
MRDHNSRFGELQVLLFDFARRIGTIAVAIPLRLIEDYPIELDGTPEALHCATTAVPRVPVFFSQFDDTCRWLRDLAGTRLLPVPIRHDADAVALRVSHAPPSLEGPPNTEISGEDRAILAVAGFVHVTSLLGGVSENASSSVGAWRESPELQAPTARV